MLNKLIAVSATSLLASIIGARGSEDAVSMMLWALVYGAPAGMAIGGILTTIEDAIKSLKN